MIGADAAASEFDTPPEVFAPAFRRLRACGLRHFTYHAGEDFFHILSGLRAIYEAIDFLGLQAGDRIGHATAAGVDVSVWMQNVGDRLWMRLADYLDDLVFAYHLIAVMKERKLESLLPRIALRIEELASKIYTGKYRVSEFIEAWLQRKEDPKQLNAERPSRPEEICLYYHSQEGRKKGKEIHVIDAYEIFGEKELVCLQRLILKVMHQKQIVIETLPTSNVIIGHHHGFSTYHLYNWYKWSKEDTEIAIITYDEKDYISLTDMVRNIENGLALIEKWLRNKNTIEFLGIWEEMYNPNFNSPEFEGIKNEAGLNRFILSVKQWVKKTNSRGIIAKAGRYGGTYAHKDIAFEFASWVSPQFKLYLLKEFQRLKEQEQTQLGWSAKRELSKINYRIHTDAIRQNLIPSEITSAQASIIYANEADVLNVAMFGVTAKQWRETNPDCKGNIRDYATINELICLSNMENLNAVFIGQGMPQGERLVKLNQIAIQQMSILESTDSGDRKLLK